MKNSTKGIWKVVNYGHCWAVECKLPDGQEHTICTDQFCHASKFDGDAESNVKAIASAYNHTIGSGINPESVGEMREALEEIRKTLLEHGFTSNGDTIKTINSALEKSKL